MASITRALLVLFLLCSTAHAAPGVGSKIFSVYTAASAACNGIPCIWSDSVTGKLKFRTAAAVDFLQGEANLITSSASDPGTPAGGQAVYNTSLRRVRFYQDGAWQSVGDTSTIGGVTAEAFFSRTCTITSAAAITPVNCLPDATVPTGKVAYLLGWHAKVNGPTPWATTTNCWIEDTGGTANFFVTLGVAALTANAFVGDWSASVTQQAPYSRNVGGTTDLGIEIACDANGTGSNLVVTLYGVIK